MCFTTTILRLIHHTDIWQHSQQFGISKHIASFTNSSIFLLIISSLKLFNASAHSMLSFISKTGNVLYITAIFQWCNTLLNSSGILIPTLNNLGLLSWLCYSSCRLRVVEFLYVIIKRTLCVMINTFKAPHTSINQCKSSFPSIKIRHNQSNTLFTRLTTVNHNTSS